MEMAQNPVLIKRKEQIFRARELKIFGVRYEKELTDEHRKQYHKIIDKNVGDSIKEKIDEKFQHHNRRLSESGRSV